MDLDAATLEEALTMLGQLLADRGEHYEVVAIGGGSLLLLEQIVRMTKDLDLVALVDAGQFISASPLPTGLHQAVNEVGIALELGKDWLADLKHLRPTEPELQEAKHWCATHDVSEAFALTLDNALMSLGDQNAIS